MPSGFFVFEKMRKTTFVDFNILFIFAKLYILLFCITPRFDVHMHVCFFREAL